MAQTSLLGRLNSARADGLDNFVVLREPLLGLLREQHFSIYCDVKLTATAWYDICLDIQRILDCGRQTGGLREIVSNFAVADRELHAAIV